MKRILLLIAIALMIPFIGSNGAIVDRTATRDTLPIPFQLLDSLGVAVDDATGDSLFIVITSPGGDEVYTDSMLFTDGRISEYVWEDYGNAYSFADRVSVLDGSSTADGVFSYMLTAHDQSLGLQTSFYGTFQIINSTLESSLDSAGIAADASLKALDSLADALDSLESISVALEAVRDSLQYLITATGFSTFDPATDSVLSANIGELIDFIWDEILATHTDAGSVGDVLLDTLDAKVSSAGGTAEISDGDMASIIDTLFQRLVSDTVASTYLSLLIESAQEIRDSLQFLITADISALALEASLFDASTDSVLLANIAEIIGLAVDSVWNARMTGANYNKARSAGRIMRAIPEPISNGIAQVSGTPTTPSQYIILAAAETAADNFYNGNQVHLVAGAGAGQVRLIEDYTGATDSVALHPGDGWTTNPDATTEYDIIGWTAQEVIHIHQNAINDIFDEPNTESDHNVANSTGLQIRESADSSKAALDSIEVKFGDREAYDPDADSTLQANIAELAAEYEDSIYANRDDYKADVSALALESSVSTAQDSLNILTGLTREMQADLDSLIWFGGYGPNSRAVSGPGADTDTMHVYEGETRLLRFFYWHVGGATGDAPDSSTNVYD